MYIYTSSLVPLAHITPMLLKSTIPRSPSLSHSPAMHLSVPIINRHLLPPRTDSSDQHRRRESVLHTQFSYAEAQACAASRTPSPLMSATADKTVPSPRGRRHRSRQCQRRYGRRKTPWSRPSSDNPRLLKATCGRNPCSTPPLQPGSSSPAKVILLFSSVFFCCQKDGQDARLC